MIEEINEIIKELIPFIFLVVTVIQTVRIYNQNKRLLKKLYYLEMLCKRR